MKRWLSTAALLVALAPLYGCSLYASSTPSNGDDNTMCAVGETDPSGMKILRNPDTGECHSLQVPTQSCAPVTSIGTLVGALPNWPACNTACDELGELDCSVTAGCHAYYDGPFCGAGSTCTLPTDFQACGSVGSPAPVSGTSCESLAVDACANADWCRSFIVPTTGNANNNESAFSSCEPALQPRV